MADTFAKVLVAVHSAGSLECELCFYKAGIRKLLILTERSVSKHGLGIHAWDIRRSSFNREEAMKVGEQ